MDYLLIIDGSSLLTTQFFGNLPREILFEKDPEKKKKYYYKIMKTSKGVYTNAVFGFMRTLLKIVREQKPKYLAVTWDLTRDTFRRELYPDYKGNRTETMEPLKDQFALCQDVLGRIGVRQFMDRRYEADDFSGTLAAKFEAEVPVRIMTKDHDYLQLVDEKTALWMIQTNPKKVEELQKKYGVGPDAEALPDKCFEFTPDLVVKEFGVEPASINSLKGLQGDTSDNIKGVPGVGEKTAVALIAEYKTVDALYAAIEEAGEAGAKELAALWKDKLGISRSPMAFLTKKSDTELVGEEAARLSETLATIKRDIDLGDVTLDSLATAIDGSKLKEAFEELEFKTLAADIEGGSNLFEGVDFTTCEDLAEAEEKFTLLLKECKAAGRRVGAAVDAREGEIKGAAFAGREKEALCVRVGGFITSGFIEDLFERLAGSGLDICMIDAKDKLAFTCESISSGSANLKDLAVAAYLLAPLESEYGFKALASKYADTTVPAGDSETDCAREAYTAFALSNTLLDALSKAGMMKIYDEIEMPLVYVLFRMQQRGIQASREALAEYGAGLATRIDELVKKIYEAAGEEFNINSPKQLGEILFGKLKLPYGKKSKTGGYSTSADILDKLRLEDPIVGDILEYRQLAKLKSTYADALAGYIREDGRIHTTFNQLVTATGRLSSAEPNLQNIPVREQMGRLIRKVFTPKEGCVFVDADYSQIELRILAHMSGDEKLIAAYNSGEDIHRITASQVFHVPVEEVDSTLRSKAKAVNFGIVYGISSFGLGQGLNISKKEAAEYIDRYFETYPGIKAFLDGLIALAREKGYAETLFGRRRPIPELESSNFMQRQFGERIAMNSPIQGTAADIMKIAMIRVEDRLCREELGSKLILQIHDELLIEAPLDEKEYIKKLLKEEMEGAVDFKVSLPAEVSEGGDWYDAK